jgi:hypothetical protein
MLVEEWFDVRGGSAVDSKRPVIRGHHNTLGSERRVLQEHAWPGMLLPVEGVVRIAITFHFFLSKVSQEFSQTAFALRARCLFCCAL